MSHRRYRTPFLGGRRSAAQDLVKRSLLRPDQLFESADFLHRQALIEEACPGASWDLFRSCATGLLGKFGQSEAAHQVAANPTMLAIARQLLGDCSLAWSGGNFTLRIKAPDQHQVNAGQAAMHTVPWHTDSAYVLPDAQDSIFITAWIPLVPVTMEMGRM